MTVLEEIAFYRFQTPGLAKLLIAMEPERRERIFNGIKAWRQYVKTSITPCARTKASSGLRVSDLRAS